MPQLHLPQYKMFQTRLAINLPLAKTVFLNWGIILTGLLLQNGLNAISLVLVARRITPVVYGQYLAAYSLVSFLVILPGFGMDAWLLTQPQTTSKSTVALWLSTLRVRSSMLIVWGLLMVLLSRLLPENTFPSSLMIPTIIGVSFDTLIFLSYASLRTQNRHKLVTLLQSLASIALFALVLFLPVNQDYISLFARYRMVLSIGIGLSVIYILGKDYIGHPMQITPAHDILTLSRPFLFSELAASIYMKADVTILSLMIGATATAVYGPAVNILQAFNLATAALFFFIVPRISKTFVMQHFLFVNRSLAQLLIQVFTGLILSIIMGLFASHLVMYIFGDNYASSIKIIRYLSPIPFLRSLNFGLAAILIAGNQQKSRSKVQVIAAISNVLGNLLVIGPFGLIGVSAMFNLSEILLVVGYGYLSINLIRDAKREIQ